MKTLTYIAKTLEMKAGEFAKEFNALDDAEKASLRADAVADAEASGIVLDTE